MLCGWQTCDKVNEGPLATYLISIVLIRATGDRNIRTAGSPESRRQLPEGNGRQN